jgi:hypothetical protein
MPEVSAKLSWNSQLDMVLLLADIEELKQTCRKPKDSY